VFILKKNFKLFSFVPEYILKHKCEANIMRFTQKNQCPYCGSQYFIRIARRSLMRMIDSVRLFECDLCRKEFIQLGGSQALTTMQNPDLVPARKQVEIVRR
jgi:transposase-like protein